MSRYHDYDWTDVAIVILWTIATLAGAFFAVCLGIAVLRDHR